MKKGSLKDRIKQGIAIAKFALGSGLAAGDKVINGESAKEGGVELNQQLHGGGVFKDLLQGQETQAVQEMRDKMYRVYVESKKVDTSTIKMKFDEKGEPVFDVSQRLGRKTAHNFERRVKAFGEDEIPVRTVQDNFQDLKEILLVGEGEAFDPSVLPKGLYDFDTTLSVERDGFVSRFDLEKFVQKMVVRQTEGAERAKVDLYLPLYASQFGKIDAILISNLHQMEDTGMLKNDITDISRIKWFSHKAWGSEDMCYFSYTDIHVESINQFDGHFVLTFDCKIESDGLDLTEKHRTEELTEKYEKETPKVKTVPFEAMMRREERRKRNKTAEDKLEELLTKQ